MRGKCWNIGQQCDVIGRRNIFASIHEAIAIEGVDDLTQILDGNVLTEDPQHGGLKDLLDNKPFTTFFDRFDFDFADC